MQRFLAERWFLIALVAVLAAGFSWPERLVTLTERVPQNLVVATVLFLMAVSLNAGAIWRALTRPGAVLLAVAINFGLLPLVAWQISGLMRSDLGVGMLIVGAVPSTLTAAAVWTRRAGGNDAVALLVTVSTNLACFVVTPLWLYVTADMVAEIPLGQTIGHLALVVLIPTLIAQCVRLYRPVALVADRRKFFFGGLAQCGILLIVGVGSVRAALELGRSEEAIGLAGWIGMLTAVVGLHVAMLAAGHLLAMAAGINREDRIAVGFSGSQKTLMVGLLLALKFSGLAILPMVAYHVCQLLVDTLVADWLRKRR